MNESELEAIKQAVSEFREELRKKRQDKRKGQQM